MRLREIAKAVLPKVMQLYFMDDGSGRRRNDNLAAVCCCHSSRGPIQRWTKIVIAARFDFTGANAHAFRQLKPPLRRDGCLDRGPRQGEGGKHAVTGVLEQSTSVFLDGPPQRRVVPGQCNPHGVRLFLPSPGGLFDIVMRKVTVRSVAQSSVRFTRQPLHSAHFL